MPEDVNLTFIALIPKVSKVESFANFRLISLYNFLYKSFAKVMANRLKLILPRIINPNQGGFVVGCQILDGIVLAHEIVHSTFTSGEDVMLLKLDISKAYDRVDWDFLMLVMRKFRFGTD